MTNQPRPVAPQPAAKAGRTRRTPRLLLFLVVVLVVLVMPPPSPRAAARQAVQVPGLSAQQEVSDAQLEAASAGRTVRLGAASGTRPVMDLPLEVYVARVLAGEAEPKAPEGEFQALAIAIRTYALVNADRHARGGFDLCDSTHCQVPRAATAATRAATLATAGQILTWRGAPAEVFYSASCGGRSESPGQVWPGADYPYMSSRPDDVHDEDVPWTLELTLPDAQRILASAGFEGRLRDVEIDDRNVSGRAVRLRLSGMQPGVIAGDQFRMAVGPTRLRSTAFSVEQRGSTLRFTGRGYGHGVGMCVIGAGRRATRGEDVRAILDHYYPGLALSRLGTRPLDPSRADTAPRSATVVDVSRSSAVSAADVSAVAQRTHDELSARLGTSIAPLTVRVHESLESFRLATGRPWWVSSVSEGTSIDLAPAALLAQRDGFDAALRFAVAELLVADALKGRPVWVRVGAARYFARAATRTAPPELPRSGRERCPADAELTLAISAPAQRDAESRAEACFARELARTREWRAVR
jgi:SpoIID/LytB domain protein